MTMFFEAYTLYIYSVTYTGTRFALVPLPWYDFKALSGGSGVSEFRPNAGALASIAHSPYVPFIHLVALDAELTIRRTVCGSIRHADVCSLRCVRCRFSDICARFYAIRIRECG